MNDLEIYYKISRSFPEEKFAELEKYYNKATKAVMEYLNSIPIEPPVKPEIADITNITMWVDMIWSDIFDDDELPLTAAQMNIIGKYINDAKEKIRKQFSV